jgi:hypothetical protein
MRMIYGWKPPVGLKQSLWNVVRWMIRPENARWLFFGKS